MQGQAQEAAAQGMALRYVGSLDLVKMTCTVELKVMPSDIGGTEQLPVYLLPVWDAVCSTWFTGYGVVKLAALHVRECSVH